MLDCREMSRCKTTVVKNAHSLRSNTALHLSRPGTEPDGGIGKSNRGIDYLRAAPAVGMSRGSDPLAESQKRMSKEDVLYRVFGSGYRGARRSRRSSRPLRFGRSPACWRKTIDACLLD